MKYRPVDGALVSERAVGQALLQFIGEQVRPERTGVHARVTIRFDSIRLAYSMFNVDKDDERVRLANSAHKFLKLHLNGQPVAYPSEYLKKDLDDFCYGLWDATLAQNPLQLERMGGTEHAAPVRFVLRPYVLYQGGTILFAHPGKGKSFLAGLMAVSIDAGRQQYGGEIAEERELFETYEPRRVVFLNLERGKDQVRSRLGAINAALGLPRTRELTFLNARGKSLADVRDTVQAGLAQYGGEVGVLDSISRAGMGDLNENQPANRIMDLMNELFPTWVAIAHAPKASEEHVFGAIQFEAAADVAVRVHSEQREEENAPLGMGLEITKGNDVGRQVRRVFAFEWAGDLGLKAVRPATAEEFPEASGTAPKRTPVLTTKEDLLRLWMADGKQATAREAALAISAPRNNVSAWFQAPAYFVTHTGKRGEKWYRVVPPGFSRGADPDAE